VQRKGRRVTLCDSFRIPINNIYVNAEASSSAMLPAVAGGKCNTAIPPKGLSAHSVSTESVSPSQHAHTHPIMHSLTERRRGGGGHGRGLSLNDREEGPAVLGLLDLIREPALGSRVGL